MLGQASGAFGYLLVMGAPALLILSYFFITWDKRRDGSENADDNQVGLKLGLFFLALVGLGMAAGGITSFLHYLLSGTKVGSSVMKSGIANILTGLIVLGGVWFVFLPRTNHAAFPRATRYTVGYVAVVSGMLAALSLNGFVDGVFNSAAWRGNAGNLASLLVFGGLAFVALTRFGAICGWTAPPPRQKLSGPAGGFQGPAGGFAQQGGPQGPQGGGFPQQGGPQGPQGGGFPPGGPQGPQGGGFPPGGGQQQGGGGGPQGGGFPPSGGPQQGGGGGQQGGGGFPAPGGGSPQGGGGGLPPPSGSGGGFPR